MADKPYVVTPEQWKESATALSAEVDRLDALHASIIEQGRKVLNAIDFAGGKGMSEPMETREEVELPSIEPTREDGEKICAWMKDYPNETSSFWAVQVRLLGRERQLKASLAANREQKAEIERLTKEKVFLDFGNARKSSIAHSYGGYEEIKSALGTEITMHAAWRKRAEEAESELASLRASVGEKPEDAYKRGQEDMRGVACMKVTAANYKAPQIAIRSIPLSPYVAPPTLPTEKEK